jgi:glycosyltransferase involved in cell wall biosynthesis
MYKPKVSIIIPVYNGANYLAEAINSALDQTYKNVEIIVVNDGSTDNNATEDIALSFGNKIKYVSKVNGKSSSALNKGISIMQGEWFSWLSHDDLYYPYKIEKEIEYLNILLDNDKNVDLNKQVIFSDFECVDKNGKYLFHKMNVAKDNMTNDEIIIEALKDISFCGCTFLLPAKCFESIGNFREDLILLNDYEYWYRLLYNNYKFHYVSEILVKMRIHANQISNMIGYGKNNKEQDELWETVINWFLKNEGVKQDENLFKIGKYAQFAGRKSDAKKAFSYAISFNPKYKWIVPFTIMRTNCYIFFRNKAKKLFILLRVK